MMRCYPLSPAESRVLELRAAGATYRDIASAECLTINEVLGAIGSYCMKLDTIRAWTDEDLEAALHTEHALRFGEAA